MRGLWILLLAAGCDDTVAAGWVVRFEDASLAARARDVEVEIVRSSCTGDEVVHSARRSEGGGRVPPELAEGRWGFRARAWDEGCAVIAAGCVEEQLPLGGGRGEIEIVLRPSGGVAAGCDAGAPPADAGEDGGIDAAIDAGPDSGADAGPDPTVCDELDVIACFDFEGDDPRQGFHYVQEHAPEATLERSTTTVYRGRGAFHARSAAHPDHVRMGFTFPPRSSGELHVRAYVYVPSGIEIAQFWQLALQEGVAPYDTVLFALTGGSPQIWSSVGMDATVPAGPAVPRDRWFCAQLEVVISDTAGSARVRIDGTLAAELTGIDTVPAEGWMQVTVGHEPASSQDTPTDSYLDEVVIDDAPLRCD